MLELIKTRRSVRSFDDKIISKEDLKELLTAGMYAPSAGNEQAWQFIILEGEILKEYLLLNQNVPATAPFGILVCRDISLEKYPGMPTSILDCAAAVENILLLAHKKGFGAIWTGIFNNAVPGVKKLLNLPEFIEPFAFIPVGFAKEKHTDIPERFDSEKIKHNSWDVKYKI